MQEYTELKDRIKEHEGYRNSIYKDSLGFATIGYGHLVKESDPFVEGEDYSETLLNQYFEQDFTNAVVGAERLVGNHAMNIKAKCVIIEMVFQLGMTGVSKFKNMLNAVQEEDWDMAANEMLDSKWATQTPHRAEDLSSIMRSCKL